jgi:Putative lumazine-binding
MATIAVLAASGCSFGGDEEAQPASGAPAQIADTVDRLERAVATKDFAAICDRLFTAGAKERAGGEDCARQLRSAAGDVEQPVIEIRAIDVQKDRATVRIRTDAEGQARTTDELQLRRQGGRWLVEALG